MTPKQLKIKQAYTIYWHEVKDHVDENGWYTPPEEELGARPNWRYYNFTDKQIERFEDRSRVDCWRPIQLQGIETNNNWITLTQETLPETEEAYWVVERETGKVRMNDFSKSTEHLFLRKFSHYQHIPKPEKPVY